jgi:hypothetical protein
MFRRYCVIFRELSDGLHFVHFSMRAIYMTNFGFLDVIFVKL